MDPSSAFVAGVKIGSGNWDACFSPDGSLIPQTLCDSCIPSTRTQRDTRARRIPRQRLGFLNNHRTSGKLFREDGCKFFGNSLKSAVTR